METVATLLLLFKYIISMLLNFRTFFDASIADYPSYVLN